MRIKILTNLDNLRLKHLIADQTPKKPEVSLDGARRWFGKGEARWLRGFVAEANGADRSGRAFAPPGFFPGRRCLRFP